ncbi:roadblock/LC7 domain-containing protein [bacterium]|nr:roadblock/LC7 domain-containing protein [bacterium]NUN44635.1 roadblock/LC7 domain-containing protein [bacterium]HMW33603.1 roadblock/LC7 domain-containing protein [bacterium]HMY36940.1 roadblock/LC7 domain-containing protein [bacterium]HMZ03952.1 roadblock/LC7 domain-containing protein [bacterium]
MEDILKRLRNDTPGVSAVALVSSDGLVISSMLPDTIEAERVAAISAALLNQGESSSEDAMIGEMAQVTIRAKEGFIIITRAAKETLLTVFTTTQAKLGLVLFDISVAIKELQPHIH